MHILQESYNDNEILEQCCKTPNKIITREGSLVCGNCGLVFGQRIVAQERRAYTNEEVSLKKRTEPRWRSYGPRTIIDPKKGDSSGGKIAFENSRLFSRLSKIQGSLINSLERNYWESRPKLNQYSLKLNIPEYITETAWKIYSIVAKMKLTMGRSIEGFVCASLYAAIRIHNFPRLLEEIVEVSLVPIRSIHRSLGLIVRNVLPKLNYNYKPISPFSLIYRFGNDLNLNISIQKNASDVLYESLKKGLRRMGKDPKGIAAACLYIAARASGEKKTQREIASVAKITEVTLRTRAKQISTRIKNYD